MNTTDQLPITEQENPRTANLSSLPLPEILQLMNDEDAEVAPAIGLVLSSVWRQLKVCWEVKRGRPAFYIGTGTSGRLGVLDAAECPPTFGVSPDLVQAVIAGGYEACYRAVEASEDDEQGGANDLKSRGFTKADALVGIAASGKTPYTVGAVSYARSFGAFTIAISCVPESPITKVAEVSIVPVVGPEVLAGSTRLKAGTAQKMVLNMLSTATLIRLGYVRGNRMTNVQTRNSKLRDRAIRILSAETASDLESSRTALEQAGGDLRAALVMSRTGRSRKESEAALQASGGVVETAVKALQST